MLSVVPLLAAAAFSETGAGGSAPKHVEPVQQEDYLRWDSLGEFLALGASLRASGADYKNAKAQVLAERSTRRSQILEFNRSPANAKVGELDQSRQPFLPRPVLASGAGPPEHRTRSCSPLQTAGRNARQERSQDQWRADRPRKANRRLGGYYLPIPPRRRRDAAERTLNAALARSDTESSVRFRRSHHFCGTHFCERRKQRDTSKLWC